MTSGEHQMKRMGDEVRPVPRFEIVQTDAEQPWLARFIGANGEQVWRSSENYTRRDAAVAAVQVLVEAIAVRAAGEGIIAIDEGFRKDDYPFFTLDGITASPMLYPVDERTEVGP